jgi:large subunit ribosomal protein L13
MKTYSMKKNEIQKDWYVIDATDMVVGRLASQIALMLKGKHKPSYTPHMDCGDNIIVINADKIYFTGKKRERNTGKTYYRHTGYMGGIKETTAGKILEGRHPERVLQLAVQRMITRNVLGREIMRNLHIYAGADHPHIAQQPKPLDIASKNNKNKKR